MSSGAAPDFPTSVGLRADGGAVVGLCDRVALWDYGEEFRTLAVVEADLPDNRLNEGRVGPDGAYWVGTMQNNLNPDGSPREITRDSGESSLGQGDGQGARLRPGSAGAGRDRSLAWLVRAHSGFCEGDDAPDFMEFFWADWFRPQYDENVAQGLPSTPEASNKTVDDAVTKAHSETARQAKLPGYTVGGCP